MTNDIYQCVVTLKYPMSYSVDMSIYICPKCNSNNTDVDRVERNEKGIDIMEFYINCLDCGYREIEDKNE